VVGGAALDAVDILHNNRVVHRWSGPPASRVQPGEAVKVHVEVGWGDRNRNQEWQVELAVEGGRLLSVEPRFRGHPVVSPQGKEESTYAFSAWERLGEAAVRFRTRTWGNVTTMTPSTQGVCLEIAGDPGTRLRGTFNGSAADATLGELLEGGRAGYLGGFRTPAYVLGRAVRAGEYTCQTTFRHEVEGRARDWYYVRVSQRNGQLAWSSPIFVEAG